MKFKSNFSIFGSKEIGAEDLLTNGYTQFNLSDTKIVALDDNCLSFLDRLNQKNLRIYSRKTRWIFEVLHKVNFAEFIKDHDPFSVGVYVAGNYGVVDWNVLQAVEMGQPIQEAMRTHMHPKHVFKYNIGIVPAHISIEFGTKGPTNAFHGYPHAGRFALEKAKFDLQLGYVSAAVVVTANIFEDILQIHFQNDYLAVSKNNYVEGVSALLLTRENMHQIDLDYREEMKFSFGYLSPEYLLGGL